jgi:hypothetical protein
MKAGTGTTGGIWGGGGSRDSTDPCLPILYILQVLSKGPVVGERGVGPLASRGTLSRGDCLPSIPIDPKGVPTPILYPSHFGARLRLLNGRPRGAV